MKWSGIEGCFFSEDGDLVAFDPSIKSKGPRTLLMNKDFLLKLLDDDGYAILWKVLGEKRVLGGFGMSLPPEDLQISGAFRIRNQKVAGVLTPKLFSSGVETSD